jgi:hypothetical protein
VTIRIKKAPQFETFGNELNAEVALLQAAGAIDMAVYLAVQSGSIEKLLDGAAMWIGMAERLATGFDSDDENEPAPNTDKPPFGFCRPAPVPVEITPDIIVEADTNEEENEDA